MKSLRFGKSVLAVLTLLIVGSHGFAESNVDLAGKWKASATSDTGDEREIIWTFTKDGDGFTGMSLDKESGDERKLDRVKVSGKQVTLEVDIERDGQTGVIRVVAKQKAPGQISGKWSVVASDGTEYLSGDISAAKQLDVKYAGQWTSVAVLPDGGEYETKMMLSGANDKLKGHFETEDGDRVAIEKITVGDKGMHCEFSFDMDGTTVEVVIDAKPKSDNKLAGEWSLASGEKWRLVRETKGHDCF